jgi:hypothetical protein
MTVTVLPFPLAKRRAYVRRQAAQIAEQSELGACRYLRQQLGLQRQSLHDKGVAPETIERQLSDLEAAIRAEACRLVKGGAA